MHAVARLPVRPYVRRGSISEEDGPLRSRRLLSRHSIPGEACLSRGRRSRASPGCRSSGRGSSRSGANPSRRDLGVTPLSQSRSRRIDGTFGLVVPVRTPNDTRRGDIRRDPRYRLISCTRYDSMPRSDLTGVGNSVLIVPAWASTLRSVEQSDDLFQQNSVLIQLSLLLVELVGNRGQLRIERSVLRSHRVDNG